MTPYCDLQAAKAPDASEFPQLSDSPVTTQPAKPVWPRVNKPVARKPASSSGWDSPSAGQGWGDNPAAGQGWGNASVAGSQSGMSAQGSRAGDTWDEGPNWVPTYDQPTGKFKSLCHMNVKTLQQSKPIAWHHTQHSCSKRSA